MTNNLRKISQDLRVFAKKTKNFKYTDSTLITFLLSGMVSATNNLFAAGDSKIESKKKVIYTFFLGNNNLYTLGLVTKFIKICFIFNTSFIL